GNSCAESGDGLNRCPRLCFRGPRWASGLKTVAQSLAATPHGSHRTAEAAAILAVEARMIMCRLEHGATAALRHVAVHAIVERDGQLLLVKRASYLPEGGKWALPGGFLDRDETLVEGVLRELREETGWEGRVIALLRINSRPDRPHEDRQNVAFDFV